jgi:hypothetical protein
MVGGYTDATNPWVRGGFYSLAKPANSGNIWREKRAGKYGGKKEREKYAGIFVPALIKIHRSCRQ